MQTKLSIAVSTLALIAALSGGAMASDLGGGLKDGTSYSETRDANRSGFYISGNLGIAEGDREGSRSISRSVDLEGTVKDGQHDTDTTTDNEKTYIGDKLDGANIPHSFDGDKLNIPLIADRLSGRNSGDFNSMTFGGEISYLYHLSNSRLGFEVGIGATFYNDAESKSAYAGAFGQYTGGTAAADYSVTHGNPANTHDCTDHATCAGDDSFYSQSGVLKFERDYDIDLIARVHYFVTDRLAVNVGGGVSWAQANASGESTVDGTYKGLNTKFDEDVDSIGFVLTAGANYWLTERVFIGAAYEYKQHSFDVDASATDSKALGFGDAKLIGHAHDSVDFDDDVHTIKGRIGFKLN